jgi:hypothetical protein
MVMTKNEMSWPDPENIINPRRPTRSTIAAAAHEKTKYDVALQAVSSLAMLSESPTDFMRTNGR